MTKNVLITGAATGLGAVLVTHFLEKGWRVWATYHKTPLPEALTSQYAEQLRPVPLDICDEASIAAAAATVGASLAYDGQRLHLLLNNAAAFSPGPLLELDAAAMLREYQSNALGPMLMVRAFRPLLTPSQSGRAAILNMSSYGSKVPLPFVGSYSASKAALNMLTDTLRLELIPYNLQIVNVLLGMVKTGVVDKQLERLGEFEHSFYWPYLRQRAAQAKGLAQKGCTPEYAAARIFEIAHQTFPANDYLVAQNPLALRLAAWLAPTRIFRYLMKRQYFTWNGTREKAPEAATNLTVL
jgi:NAD(P)-dependent dehydrogenase (short-subunit alcohol dehydrogenase family)